MHAAEKQPRSPAEGTSKEERIVEFRFRDVIVPNANELLMELFGDQVFRGRVVDESRCGREGDRCAVLSVDGVRSMVVVRV